MRRHRSTFELDEAPKMDGDGAFAGVDMVTAPDKLPPGMAAWARNRVFEDGECRVRKGCASMVWSNPMGCAFDGGANNDEVTFEPVRPAWNPDASYYEGDEVRYEWDGVPDYYRASKDLPPGREPNPFLPPPADWELLSVAELAKLKDTAFFNDFLPVTMRGAGRFSDPAGGYEWMVLVLEDRAIFCRQFQFPQEYSYPEGVTIAGPCTLTQAYEKLILWRGEVPHPTGEEAYAEEYEPLVFSFETGWQLLSEAEPDPGDGTKRMPNASRAVYFGNRLWAPFRRDAVAVSDLLSMRWDEAAAEEVINFGESDRLTGLRPYDRTTLLCFKARRVYALLNVAGDLSDMTLAVISSEVGALAPESIAGWGAFAAFLGEGGVWTLQQVDESRVQVADKPLSYPIQPVIDRINWNRAEQAASIVHEGRLYVAVPYGTSEYNGTVLVYNINRGVWEGVWDSEDWKIVRWVKGKYFGRTRLYFWHADGYLVLLDHGDEDEIGPETYEISSELKTRGYNAAQPERMRGLRLLLNLRGRRSIYSAQCTADQVANASRLVTDREPSRTRRRRIGQGVYDPTNINDDADEPGREDYTAVLPGPESQLYLKSGVKLELEQEWEEVFPLQRAGRYVQAEVTTARGQLTVQAARLEGRAGRRDSRAKGF